VKGGRPTSALTPPPSPRSVLTLPADAITDKSRLASVECNQWPAAFAGGPDNQYCCDRRQPVTLVECKGASCAYRPLDATCPEAFSDDGARLYFAEETRVVVLDRKTQKISILSKRKRQPRSVTLGGSYVYWFEGETIADIFRIKNDASDTTSAEMIARRLVDATELAAGDRAVFWVARAPADTSTLAKRGNPSKPKPGAAGHASPASGAPRALYTVTLAGN
jgi:hypothetical protein